MRVSAHRTDGTGTQYRGSMVYTEAADGGLELDCALTSGGRIANDAGTLQVQHFIRDHLGSVRTVVDGSTGDVLETSDYLPFGKRWELTGGQAAQTITDPTNRWRFSGKETQSFYNPAIPYNDFGARLHDPRTGRWLGVDPMAEKYYFSSVFSYCYNSPVNIIDILGMEWKDANGNILENTDNIKRYIYYSSDFKEQAMVQYRKGVELYGEGSVALSITSTAEEFAKDWGNMGEGVIADVMIMTHGKNQSIVLGNEDQLTSTGNSRTNLSNNLAMNVQDLPKPSGDLSHATLYMFSCHSADITEKAHGKGVHEQGDLSGSKEAIAYTFTREFGFYQGIGTSESVNYHSFMTDFTPPWSPNYLQPYPANGGTWKSIRKAR